MNKNHNPTPSAFERLLARYRELVSELFFLQKDSTDSVAQPERNKQTILSIEDNADEWFFTQWALNKQFPEAKLVWLSDPTQVIPHLDTCQQTEKDLPSLILLDLYLPTSAVGFGILQALKSHPVYYRIPLVVLSRSSQPVDITDAIRHSANSYIVKPSTYQEWVEELAMLHFYC